MTIRLENSFIRGEIDCREPGVIKGRLWLLGRAEPLEIELIGLPSKDMAGVMMGLKCDYPPTEQAPALSSPQKGHVLECTGCKRKNVPVGAEQEIKMRIRKRIPHTWEKRTVMHLEWINAKGAKLILEATGLVVNVLESSDWSPSAVELSDAEAVRKRLRDQWAEHQPFDRLLLPELPEEQGAIPLAEKEADREDEKMERLNDRIQARLKKLDAFSEEEYEKIYAEERERLRIEYGEPEPEPLTPEQLEDQAQWVEEMNRLAEEALHEWEAGELVEPDRHPLLVQCDTLQEKVTQDLRESDWMPDAPGQEHPLRELNWGFHMATAKMSGGLGLLEHKEWPPEQTTAAIILVKTKQARDYLRDVLTALDAADEENLGCCSWRNAVRDETLELLQEVELLILELRGLLS